MLKEKSIKKNMLMSVLLTSSNFIFPLITYSYVARVLTPSGTGKVAFVYSILSYFSYLAILGIPSYGLREVAKHKDDVRKRSQLVQELLVINLCSTAIAYVLLFVIVIIIPRLYMEKWLFVVMGGVIFLNTIGLEWVYQALEEYTFITVRSLIFKVISVILTFFLIKKQSDYLYYGFLHIFTNSASYLFNFFHVRKFISFRRIERWNLKKHLKPIITLFAASICITIYANFDVTMIGFISTENEVGLYNAAMKIRSVVISLSSAVTVVLIPRLSYYLKNNSTDKVKSTLEKSLRVSLVLSFPIAIYIILFAKECLAFLCGKDYIDAANILRVLIGCVFALILTNLFGNQILIPSGNEKRFSQSVFIGMWINLIANFIMIPSMGALGAAIATLITECWNVIWMSGGVVEYRKFLAKKIKFVKYIVPVAIASIAAKCIAFVITVPLFWLLCITASTFFGLYYILLLVEKEPIIRNQLRNVSNKLLKMH